MTPPIPATPDDGPTDVLRVSGPRDLVQAIPYLVGFPPRDSVVVVALGPPRHRVVMTARVDLDADPVEALSRAWPAAAGHGATSVVLTVHDDSATGRPLPWRSTVEVLARAAEEAGLALEDALCVGSDRFWSYRCTSDVCCPAGGTPVQRDGRVAAELVLRGKAPVARREDLAAEVAVDRERAARVAVEVERLPRRTAGAGARRAAAVALLDTLARRSPAVALDDVTAAEALVALTDVCVRDTQLVRRRGRKEARAAQLWCDLVRAAPSGLRAAPLVLAAVAAYRRGDGARANVALEAALADQPGYALADLVARGIAGAITPSRLCAVLDEAALEVRQDLDRRVGGRSSA
jgi:Domain of unknown function (DUF4192)